MTDALYAPLREKLIRELDADRVDIVDNSWMHAGHGASGSHLCLTVVSPRFEGLGLLDRHRRVHRVLAGEMRDAIHALELKTYTAREWESR